ncbi:MAG: hypothetical protein KBF88_17830 [Polyangiaceae bacterium]|nr:hypothetical protein [Polyangiaceae bacterium]
MKNPIGLKHAIEGLSPSDRAGLERSQRFLFDPSKRLDKDEQFARHLLHRFRIEKWNEQDLSLLHLLIEHGFSYSQRDLPIEKKSDVAPFLFSPREKPPSAEGTRSCLPLALALSVPKAPFEHAYALRPLLVGATSEQKVQIAKSVGFGIPVELGLEHFYLQFLRDPKTVLATLSTEERSLLKSLQRVGGIVEAEELYELEESLLKSHVIQGGKYRRGPSLGLERRGLLFPMASGQRFVVPREYISGPRLPELSPLEPEDPTRADFASDAGAISMFAWIRVRQMQTRLAPGGGISKRCVAQIAAELSLEETKVAMLLALFREATAQPELRFGGILPAMLAVWARSEGWDETLEEPEVRRNRAPHVDAYHKGVLLEVLFEHARSWIPVSKLVALVARDERSLWVERRLKRGRKGTLEHWTRVFIEESLRTLGILDFAEGTRLVRISRFLRSHGTLPTAEEETFFIDGDRADLPRSVPIQWVETFGLFGVPVLGRKTPSFRLTRESVASGFERGATFHDFERLRTYLVTQFPSTEDRENLERVLTQFTVRTRSVALAARAVFRLDDHAADLFQRAKVAGVIELSGGWYVATSLSALDQAKRAARALGVELIDEQT